MNKLMLASIVACGLCAGCTYTKVNLIAGTLTRISVLEKADIPKISAVTTNNVLVSMEGYSNDGGSAASGVIVEKAVSAAVKAATP